MLHQKLEVLGSLGDCLPGRANFYTVVLRGAALLRLASIETGGSRTAAWVPRRVRLEVKTDFAGMVAAMVDLSSEKLLVTMGASVLLQTGEHLPEYILPRNLLLAQEHDKLIDVPVLVALMLGNRVAVVINVEVRLRALDPLSLVACVQRAAVHAPLEHVVFFLEQVLQLFHE